MNWLWAVIDEEHEKLHIFQENCYFFTILLPNYQIDLVENTSCTKWILANFLFLFLVSLIWKRKKMLGSSIETSTFEKVINKLINIPELFIFIGKQIYYR